MKLDRLALINSLPFTASRHKRERRLYQALTICTVESILPALGLAGMIDTATVFEVCRCAIYGSVQGYIKDLD